jgi:hypothetical protein
MATSTQDMARVGEPIDLFYYDSETSKKQAFPTTVNTKYVQNFQNLNGGSQVFTIPPNSGVQDVVVSMAFAGLGAQTGLALPQGWGYALIKQVSFRYGGSSQYFISGDQVLQNALRRQPSRSTANDLLNLGGNFASSGTTPDLSGPQYANVVLVLPHATPTGVGKAHPFPSDLLTQQIQITVELYPVNQIWTTSTGGSPAPMSLMSGQFQVQQVVMNNAGDALARRVDMATNAYAYPCEFVQQIQRIPLANSAGSQSVVLTGFRSGEVKAIHCWLSRTSETGLNNLAGTGAQVNDTVIPFKWYLPNSVTMTYAGDVYARYEASSSPLWNLINGDKAPAVDSQSIAVGTPPVSSAFLSQWVELPFAQTMLDCDANTVLVHGKPITNGIVNLDIVTPSAQADWVLNVSYIYNTTLLMSQGTCDFVF